MGTRLSNGESKKMNEFFHMGGYAVYVWSSYGISLVLYALVYYIPKRAHKRILQQLKGQYKRQQKKTQMNKTV